MTHSIQKYAMRTALTLEAFGLGIELPALDDEHPNRVPFQGILTRLNEASTRPPNGTRGEDGRSHRVMIPTSVAEAALPTLIGMPIDSSLRLDNHDKRQVIGIITSANIQGNDLLVGGHLFGKNFPEEVQEIQERKDVLGMSYEISQVLVEDPDEDIWTLASLQFTGAAILRKDAAAYAKTAIAANADEEATDMAMDTLTKKIDTMSDKLDELLAAKDEEAEAAAKCHEEDAARHEESAKRAREDGDEDAAKCHDEDAAKCWIMAAKKHEEMAKRYTEEADAQADEAAKADLLASAKTHEEAAKRIHDADAARVDAAKKAEEDAAKVKSGDDEVARMGMLMSAFLKAMAYPGGTMMGTKKEAEEDAKHDDEAEDIKLFRKLMKQGQMSANRDDAQETRSTGVDIEVRRRLRNLEASVELLTDNVNKALGLLTDTVTKMRGLATDGHQDTNGGKVATRKTMQATGEHWVGKFDNRGEQTKLTMDEVEQACAGLDNRAAMAKKLELMAQGRL